MNDDQPTPPTPPATPSPAASPPGRGEPSPAPAAAPTEDAAPDAASLNAPPTDDALLDAAGQALFQLGRLFARQPLPHLLAERTGRAVERSRVLVVQTIQVAAEDGAFDVSVGQVAERLGIDPSTASRLVAETIQAGYLARTTSPTDGRRLRLTLTPAGHTLADQARRYQRAIFEQVTRAWPAAERRAFAARFIDFAAAVATAHAAETAAPTAPPDTRTP